MLARGRARKSEPARTSIVELTAPSLACPGAATERLIGTRRTLGDPESHQCARSRKAFGGANPFLAVTGTTGNGVIGDVKIEDFDVVSVPESGTLALLLTGVAELTPARKRRNSI